MRLSDEFDVYFYKEGSVIYAQWDMPLFWLLLYFVLTVYFPL